MMDELIIERKGNVKIATLNRPEVMNALTYGMPPAMRISTFLEKRPPVLKGR